MAHRPRPRAQLEELEPRILYSADLAAVLGSAAGAGASASVQEQRLLATPASAASGKEVAFVDLAAPDAHTLVAGLIAQRDDGRDIEVITIAADEDGLGVISRSLAAQQGITAVHLLSHGGAGRVQLGSAVLDGDSMLMRASELAGWSTALSADADVMIYGCDVATNERGMALLNDLAALTGADVAASDDLTGNEQLGGDWQLEWRVGLVQTPELAPAAGLAGADGWQGTLANEARASTTTANSQTLAALNRGADQALAVAGDGSYALAWTSVNQDGSGAGVYARRFAVDGTPLTAEILVPSATSGNQSHAHVASDAAGNFVVTWFDDGNGTDGEVMVRRFAADGTALGAAQVASAFTTGAQTNPTIAPDGSNGGFVVAWQGVGPGNTVGVWMRRFDAAGVARDAGDIEVRTVAGSSLTGNLGQLSAEVNNANAPRNPALAVDGTGGVVVAYELSRHLYFQRFTTSGAAAGSSTQVDNGASDSIGPAIAMDAAGNFTIVHREQTTLPGVWGRGFNADGTSRYTYFYAASGDAASPDIAMAPDGRFIVTYQKTGASGIEVYARHFTASGGFATPAGAAYLLNTTTAGDQVQPSIALVDPYQYAVAWSGAVPGDGDGVALRTFENTAPTITSNGGGSSASLTVAENSTAVTTVQSSDPDLPAQTRTYAIAGGADAASFTINASTGALSFSAAPDFEAPADAGADNVYDVTVSVSDGLDTDSQALAVTVSNQAISAISVTGASAVSAGDTYALNLSANEQATSWTINWGDGTIQNVAGNPASVTHVYTRAGFTFNVLASATDAQGTVHSSQLVVPTYNGRDSLMRFGAMTGAFLQEFANGAGLNDPTQAVVGPDGLLYVSGEASGNVLRFNATSGALVDTFIATGSGGLTMATGLAFGPDGHLYVASYGGNQVLRYDGATGAFIDSFIASVNRPYALSFGPDGRLYVGLYNSHAVNRYDASTGALVDTFITPGSGGLDTPEQITFGPDGHLYVASDGTNSVLRYDGASGAFLGAFVPAGSGGLSGPSGLAFGPDGHLYVASHGTDSVHRYDGSTGAHLGAYVAAGAGGLDTPALMSFLPQQQVKVLWSNQPPVVGTPLVDQAASEDSPFNYTFSAGSFTDADIGDTLSYGATLDSGAPLPGWLNFNAATRTFSGNPLNEDVGTIHVRVTASDSTAASVHDDFQITVANTNDAPLITSDGGGSSAVVMIDENNTAVTTVQASDADLPAQPLSFSISGGADAALFNLHPSTGVLSFITAPDFEAPADADADNVYEVTVQVSDGLMTSDQSLSVVVGDVSRALTVSTTSDTLDGDTSSPEALNADPGADGLISLREAVIAANNAGGTDQITLPAGNYTLTRSGSNENAALTGDLNLVGTLTLQGAGADLTRVDGGGLDRVFDLRSGADVTMTGFTVTGGAIGSNWGGGINTQFQGSSLTLDQMRITGNSGSSGAGLYVYKSTLTVTDSTIDGNSGVSGAGLYNDGGQASLERVTISGNTATQDGGGIYSAAMGATLSLTNVTLSDNAAGDQGGGLFNRQSATLQNVTVAYNTASSGGGIELVNPGSVSLRNTIIAHNTGGNANTTLTSLGNNIDSGSNLGLNQASDLSDTDPLLGPLQANGGPIETHALLDGSPAIDTGHAASSPATDQRGQPRVGQPDIGSFEAGAAVNASPVNTAPTGWTVAEDSWGSLAGISVADADLGQGTPAHELSNVSLAVLNGSLQVTLAGAASITAGANASASLTVSGSQGDLNATLASLQYRGAADFAGDVSLSITSRDAAGLNDSDSVTIAVTPVDDAPVISSDGGGANATLTVPENSTAVTTVQASDVDLPAQTITYSIAGGADAARFSIDAATGALSFVAAPDFEAPSDADADHVYQVMVAANDGSLGASQSLSVQLSDAHEPPAGAGDQYLLAEDQTLVSTVAGGWYDAAWSTRQRVNLDNTAGPQLTNTVVLVTLDTGAVDYSRLQGQGEDLRFVGDDGSVLDHDIETWNPAGTSSIWVRVPSIAAASGSGGFWAYYGNGAAPALQNPAGVWADARVVLHLGATLADGSPSANPVNESATSVAAGVVGSARGFDGAGSTLNIGSAAAVDDLFQGGGAISAWIRPTGWGEGSFGRIASKASTPTATAGWALQLDGANQSLLFEHGFSAAEGRWRAPVGAIALNAWQHVAVVYDASSPGNVPQVFVNGVALALSVSSAPSGSTTSDAALALTIGNHAVTPDRTFQGSIDEFRAYDASRSAGQILAEVRAGSGALASLGAAQTAAPGVLNNDTNLAPSAMTASLVSGPVHAASFSLNPDGTFSYVPVADYFGADSFTYRASNGSGDSLPVTVNLMIAGTNDAPVITSAGGGATAATTAPEDQLAVTTLQASDPDGTVPPLSWSIAGGADASHFAIDGVSGVLTFVTSPDFDAPADADADNVYQLIVQVSDGALTDTQALSVTVTSTNLHAPVITSDGGGASAALTVDEATQAVTTVSATDADLPAQTLTYSVSGGADAPRFAIDAVTGALRFVAAPDFETPADADRDGVYTVTVAASDGAGLIGTQDLIIGVRNLDEAPAWIDNRLSVSEGSSALPSVQASDADTPPGALRFEVQALAGGWFEDPAAPGVAISTFTQADVIAGRVRFVADGGEQAPTYELVLTDGVSTLPAQAAGIQFTPVNDVPVVAAVDLGVSDEDQGLIIDAASLLSGAQDAEGDALRVTGLRVLAGNAVVDDLGAGRWQLQPAADWSGSLILQFEVSDRSDAAVGTAQLRVQALNDAPAFTDPLGQPAASLATPENARAVSVLSAADVDSISSDLRFAIVGGDDASRFRVDAVSGALEFIEPPDHEASHDANGDGRYELIVAVSDGQAEATQTLAITVTDVDEAPVVERQALVLSAQGFTLVLQARDPEGATDSMVYQVLSTLGGRFELREANSQPATRFTQADIDAGRVRFVADGSGTEPSFRLALSDGVNRIELAKPELVRTAEAKPPEAAVPAHPAQLASPVTQRTQEEAAPPANTATSAQAPPLQAAAPLLADRVAAAAPGPAPALTAEGPSIPPLAVPGASTIELRLPSSRVESAAIGSNFWIQSFEALELAGDSGFVPRELHAFDLLGGRSSASLAQAMDAVRLEDNTAPTGVLQLDGAGAVLVSSGLSVGYVLWLARGGALAASLISSVPAWASVDPLPVLAQARRNQGGSEGEEDDEFDPVEQLFSRARRLLRKEPVAQASSKPTSAPADHPSREETSWAS